MTNKRWAMQLMILLSALALSALVASSCGREEEESTIEMVPFSSQAFGIQGVAPARWAEPEPGAYLLEEGVHGPASLIVRTGPEMSLEQATGHISFFYGRDDMLQSSRSHNSETLSWQLFTAEFEQPEVGETILDIALAEADRGVCAVLLQAPKADSERLHDDVFMKVVDSIEPMEWNTRDRLTAAELLTPKTDREEPVNNVYLLPMGNPGPAEHTFEGMVMIPEFKMAYRSHSTTPHSSHTIFPSVAAGFFTYQDFLVPVQRDIIRGGGESNWHIILSPGKVWSEPGDEDLSRASFPFVLLGDDSQEAHNGVATFLFGDSKISSLYVQVTQETVAWHHTDFWGQSPVTYEPEALADRKALEAEFADELANQLPVRPWSALEGSVDPFLLASFTSNNDLANISATGLVRDDVIYLQSCYTRYGAFPYCQAMRHSVMSVTKSMGASIAMLRLAQKYGEQILDLKLADYVAIKAEHDGWDNVTFGDALNMATGIGDHQPRPVEPNVMHGDEDQQKFMDFLGADSAREKLEIAFSYGDYPWGPGEIARYNSINTFVLSAAMDNFLKSQEGPQADIWEMVIEEVYRPIGIPYTPIMRTVEPDGSRGLSIFGYGLYPTVGDVAKVAKLLHDGGRHEGRQLLHSGMLAKALYQTDELGYPSGESNPDGNYRYNLSFWGFPYRGRSGDFILVPYMMGFGGNLVVVNPNGITAFRFSDGHNYDVAPMVRLADAMEPFSTQ